MSKQHLLNAMANVAFVRLGRFVRRFNFYFPFPGSSGGIYSPTYNFYLIVFKGGSSMPVVPNPTIVKLYDKFAQLGWDPDFYDAVTIDLTAYRVEGLMEKGYEFDDKIDAIKTDEDMENFITELGRVVA